MANNKEKIKALEQELKKTKYNKATQGHIGIVKAKIAQLKQADEQRASKKTGQSEHGYSVRKSGDATVVLLGFPSAGKSTLLNSLTGSKSEVGEYAFTTLTVIPGMMNYKQAKIQILDVPGIVSGAASGRGRGKEVLAVIRNADLVLLVVDVTNPNQFKALKKEVWETGIRLNKTKPEVFIKKTGRGGIHIGKTVKIEPTNETMKKVLRQFKFNNADILIRSEIDIDDFIDCIEGHKKYLPAITCVTKSDLATKSELDEIISQTNAEISISTHKNKNITKLKNLIYKKLSFMRIYLKEPRKEADMKEPLIVRKNDTIGKVCLRLHKDFEKKFRFSRVWGKSAKFPGQRLMLNHTLKDGDILEIHLR